MEKGARFSRDRKYRYALWRIWDESLPYTMFIGLNPSTADENSDDPTLVRCIRFAQSWGYGGVYMTNLFAFCATDPRRLGEVKNPIGVKNNHWIATISESAGVVIAAWGNQGILANRASTVVNLIPELHYLKMNRSGQPAHPLYLKMTLRPRKLK